MQTDRLSNILEAYLGGELRLDTAAAELTHVYLERGWAFFLVEAECRPEHLARMRALAERVHASARAPTAVGRSPRVAD
jgi:hypothetical protein